MTANGTVGHPCFRDQPTNQPTKETLLGVEGRRNDYSLVIPLGKSSMLRHCRYHALFLVGSFLLAHGGGVPTFAEATSTLSLVGVGRHRSVKTTRTRNSSKVLLEKLRGGGGINNDANPSIDLSQDPNPPIALEELEDMYTNDDIDAVLDQIIGKTGGIIMHRYHPSRRWLWRQWYATVLYHSLGHALGNMVAALLICTLLRYLTFGDYQVWELPKKVDTSTVTDLYDVIMTRLAAISTIWKSLAGLTTFLLTFFVGQAFGFWRTVYDLGRNIQGRMNDIGFVAATHAARKRDGTYTHESKVFLEDLAGKLSAYHVLLWATLARRFRVLLTDKGMSRMVARGIMAHKEKEIIDRTTSVPKTQKHTVMLGWILFKCRQAQAKNILQGDCGLEQVLVDKACALRSASGHRQVSHKVNGRMPLAYAHLVQVLVDSFLVLSPIAQYADLGIFAVLSVGILTIFYSGLLDLAKVFLDPLDNEDYREGCVYMDLAVLIRESNGASKRWMNGASKLD